MCNNPTVTMTQAMLSDDIFGDSSGDIDVTTTVSATVGTILLFLYFDNKNFVILFSALIIHSNTKFQIIHLVKVAQYW